MVSILRRAENAHEWNSYAFHSYATIGMQEDVGDTINDWVSSDTFKDNILG